MVFKKWSQYMIILFQKIYIYNIFCFNQPFGTCHYIIVQNCTNNNNLQYCLLWCLLFYCLLCLSCLSMYRPVQWRDASSGQSYTTYGAIMHYRLVTDQDCTLFVMLFVPLYILFVVAFVCLIVHCSSSHLFVLLYIKFVCCRSMFCFCYT